MELVAENLSDDPQLVAIMAKDVLGTHRDYSDGSNIMASPLEKLSMSRLRLSIERLGNAKKEKPSINRG